MQSPKWFFVWRCPTRMLDYFIVFWGDWYIARPTISKLVLQWRFTLEKGWIAIQGRNSVHE